MWQRCNLKASVTNHWKSEGQGRFFMIRVNHLLPDTDSTVFLEKVVKLATLSLQMDHCTQQQEFIHTQTQIRSTDAEAKKNDSESVLKSFDNIDYECCVTYEVLKPDNGDTSHDIIEWVSWTSRDAFVKYLYLPYVVELDEILGQKCEKPREVMYWERQENGFFSL